MVIYQTRDDEGGRFVAIGAVKNKKVEVVVGWDVISDTWRYHVYIMDGTAPRKVNGMSHADSKKAAFDEGFKAAEAAI
jgi:hypothetical protein